MITSNRAKPLYVYLQRPDTSEWVVVGRYQGDAARGVGSFQYAPSYCDAGLAWPIDPVNLPFLMGAVHIAHRYGGLHDVLRDTCPDSWGQLLLRLKHDLPERTSPVEYLRLVGNGDRWGALAIGPTPKPSVAHLSSPKLHKLDELVAELLAISERRPPVSATLRKQLFATASLGGARPKATIQEGDAFWLVKPGLNTDTVDLALLEHATQQLGREAGLRFADTRHHVLVGGTSVVRVLRFDRCGARRIMAVSGASLLQVQYPFTTADDSKGASYPRLAEELKRIGAPKEDLEELFGRMIFNAMVGNDDDHPRNHAVIFVASENRWRLSPAFDVVPNPDENPARLVMQVSAGRRDIEREAMLADYSRFGFATKADAEEFLVTMVMRIHAGFAKARALLSLELARLMDARIAANGTMLVPI
ncbi:MAG: HipA domain-containing protein [Pseudomonadota bacterium]